MVKFEMSNLGLMHYFLGIEIVQSAGRIFISQKRYVRTFLGKFGMKDCNPINTPSEFCVKLVNIVEKGRLTILFTNR